jgi:copper chaperone CopZ
MDTPGSDKNEFSAPTKATRTIAVAVCWWIALFVLLLALTVESHFSAPRQMRPIVAGLAAVTVGIGFFLAFGRRPPTGSLVGLRRFNTVMLWLVVAAVAAYALVPRAGPGAREVGAPKPLSVKPGVDEERLGTASRRTFTVEGMVCQSCVQTVTEALLGVPGVLAAEVELESGRAVVSSAGDASPPDTSLVNAIVTAGYKARRTAGGDGAGTDRAEEKDD